MDKNSGLTEAQCKLLSETLRKNEWASSDQAILFVTWANYHASPEVLRNYLCKDGSGYIRGYYDRTGTFYVKRYHLRDEEWADPNSSKS